MLPPPVLIGVGVAGLTLDAQHDTAGPSAEVPAIKVAQSAVDRPGPLYVLPGQPVGVANPYVASRPLHPYSGLVIGQRSGEEFATPVWITVTDSPPAVLDDTWTRVDVATGVAYVHDDWPSIQITQQRDIAGSSSTATVATNRSTPTSSTN